MGLAEQKKKQRIGEDPQNTNWTKDPSRFGFKMLEKMGWTPGKGLGANGKGTLEPVKAAVKKNQYGLGFDAKTSDNWIENTSGFAQLLKKLNTVTADVDNEETEVSSKSKKEKKKSKKEKKDKKETSEEKEYKKRSLEESLEFDSKSDKVKASDSSKKSKKSKKEKEVSEETTSYEKKSKKSKKEKSERTESVVSSTPQTAPRLCHRARYVQNKKLSTSDPSVLSAIFGIPYQT